MAGRRGAASWVWANIRRQYREEKERYDSYADRSGDRGLALCGCAGAVRLRRHAHRQCPILRPPHARRRAGGGAVHGGLRVLDLLPAPLAAADRAHAAEGCNDDGARADRSGRANAAAQSGDGYHAARRSGFAAAVRRAGKSAPRALGLRRTVLLMFSHVWVVSKLSGEVVELHEEGLS